MSYKVDFKCNEKEIKNNKSLETNDYDLAYSTYRAWMNEAWDTSFRFDYFNLELYSTTDNIIYYSFQKLKVK